MTDSLGDAVLELSTDDSRLDRGLTKAEAKAKGSMSRMGGAAKTVGTAMTVGITAPITGIGIAAVNAFGNFDQTIRQVGASAGISGGALEAMKGTALALGAETAFSAQQAADAMLELSKGGMTAAEIKAGALKETLTLAAAGGLELGAASTYMANTLNTFGLAATDGGKVAAALAGGANASTASVESLGMALSQVGPGAKQAGLSLNETVGALAAFDQAGVKGSDAGTSLKTMLQRLVPQTDEAKQAMADLGLQFVDAQGNFKPLTNIAQQLQDKLGGLSEAQRTAALTTIFGSDASRAAGIMADQGAAGLQKMIDATNDKSAAERMAKTNTEGLKGSIEQMMGSLETAAITIGGMLAPMVTKLADVVTKLTNQFMAAPAGVKMAAMAMAGIAAVIGPILLGITAVTAILPALGVLLGAIVSPVGLLVIGLAALAAWWLHSGDNMQKFQDVLGKVAAFVTGVAWPAIVDGAKKALRWYQTKILPTIKGVMTGLAATLTTWFGWAKSAWNQWGSAIIGYVKAAFTLMKTVVETAVGVIGNVIQAVLAVLRGDWSGAWEAMKAALKAALTGAVAILKASGQMLLAAAKLAFAVVKTGAKLALKALGKVLLAALKAAWAVAKGIGPTLLSGATGLGGDIIDGLLAGIKAGASKIVSALSNLAGDALHAAKKKLHIASPSRLFRDEVGLPIAQGIAVGIMRGIPGVVAANQKALDAAREGVDAVKKQMEGLPSMKAADNAVTRAQAKRDKARQKLRDVSNPKKSLLSARQSLERAQAAVNRARGTKSTADDKAAALQLKQAKQRMAQLQADIRAGKAKAKAAFAAAQKELKAAQAQQTLVKQLTADLQAAEAAAAAAEAAVAQAEERQAGLEQALSDIRDAADLTTAMLDLQDAIAGKATQDSMTKRIEALKSEYAGLQKYLQDNAADLSTTMQTDVYSSMADVLGEITDLQTQLRDMTEAATTGNATTGASTGTAGNPTQLTRLPGQIAGAAGGNAAPLIGSMTVNGVTDIDNAMRRIDWSRRQVGAY